MPCTRCRTRHYRCDGKQPQCGRCQQADKECVYDTGRRFRRSSIQEAFSSEQQWATLPTKFEFVDNSYEARHGVREPDDHSEAEYSSTPTVGYTSPGPMEYSSTTPTLGYSSPGAEYSSTTTPTAGYSSPGAMEFSPPGSFVFQNPHPSMGSPTSLIGPTQSLAVSSLLTSDASPRSRYPSASAPESPYGMSDYNRFTGQPRNAPIQPPPSTVKWPLEGYKEAEMEAMLLRNYVENVALFFDMVDDQRHFGNCLVQLSRKNITLWYAILALSARHLSNTKNYSDGIAMVYYDKSTERLLEYITHVNERHIPVTDEHLATMIILRLYEEMSMIREGFDPKFHFESVKKAVAERYRASYTGGLQQAIYWAAFRQELWMSLIEQRPFELETFRPEKSFGDASDSVWATRSIAHVAEVCHFVFGKEKKTLETIRGRHPLHPLSDEDMLLFRTCENRYKELLEDNRKWRNMRPSSFDPFYETQNHNRGKDFPDIRLHEYTHVVGRQYNMLALALLVAHQPIIDPNPKVLEENRDFQVRAYVRELCGVATSNPRAFPAMLVACFAIARVGDRFKSREDQVTLKKILLDTQDAHGFPTAATRNELEEAWGWPKDWAPMQ